MRWLRLCALTTLVILSSMALSQTSPDLEQGMKPYGSFHGGNLDHNSLTNGNLFFQADLVSYSQREVTRTPTMPTATASRSRTAAQAPFTGT